MSGEHFVSAALLRRLEQDGGVHIHGFPWQGGMWRKLSIGALASNVLCKQHNSDLSALDAVVEKLVDHLESVEHEFQTGDQRPWIWALNGHDVERWLLKALAGLLLSKSGRTTEGEALKPEIPRAWIDILFARSPFPLKWGLYVVGELGHTFATEPKKYSFAPVSLSGNVVGIRAQLVGYAFTLLMTEPGRPAGAIDEYSIYRPRYLSVEHAGQQKGIYFHWDQLGPEHPEVNLTWSAATPAAR